MKKALLSVTILWTFLMGAASTRATPMDLTDFSRIGNGIWTHFGTNVYQTEYSGGLSYYISDFDVSNSRIEWDATSMGPDLVDLVMENLHCLDIVA